MFFGKVIGTIWATRKTESMHAYKLQIVQPIDAGRHAAGDPIVAVDTVGAGPGETVFYVTSREATIPLPVEFSPVDASIVGIVDRIDVSVTQDDAAAAGQRKRR
jgi:ethanolamine utilization protein EutN